MKFLFFSLFFVLLKIFLIAAFPCPRFGCKEQAKDRVCCQNQLGQRLTLEGVCTLEHYNCENDETYEVLYQGECKPDTQH